MFPLKILARKGLSWQFTSICIMVDKEQSDNMENQMEEEDMNIHGDSVNNNEDDMDYSSFPGVNIHDTEPLDTIPDHMNIQDQEIRDRMPSLRRRETFAWFDYAAKIQRWKRKVRSRSLGEIPNLSQQAAARKGKLSSSVTMITIKADYLLTNLWNYRTWHSEAAF